jgi:TonB family protein
VLCFFSSTAFVVATHLAPRSFPQDASFIADGLFFLTLAAGGLFARFRRKHDPAFANYLAEKPQEEKPRRESQQRARVYRGIFAVAIAICVLIYNLAAAPIACNAPNVSRPHRTSTALPANAYPQEALEKKEQGDTLLTITVANSGKVTSGYIAQSSGHQDLDHAALALVKKYWVFDPARKDGKNIDCRLTFNFAWELPANS